jgi:predicted MFS family arabinose efflux permease
MFAITPILSIYKNAFSGLNPKIWLLSVVTLINRSGTMIMPFMALYVTQHLKLGIAKAGVVTACFGLGAILGVFIGGRLTDKIGFYYTQLLALFGGGIMFIAMGQVTDFNLLCVFTFIAAFLNDAMRPANSAAISFYSKVQNKARSFSLNRLAVNLGWSFGGALGGFIAHRSYTLLFWVDGITNIAAAVVLLLLLPKPTFSFKQSLKQKIDRTVASPFADRLYLIFLLLTIFFAICFFQTFHTLPVFFKEKWLLQEDTIGYILALNGVIIVIVEMPLIYWLSKKKNSMAKAIPFGILVLGVSYAVLNILPIGIATAIVSVVLFTLAELFAMPLMNTYWTDRAVQQNMGQYASLYSMAYSIGFVAGPLSGTQIADGIGFNFLWWAVMLACVLVAWAMFALLQKSKSSIH